MSDNVNLDEIREVTEKVAQQTIAVVYSNPYDSTAELEERLRLAARYTFDHLMRYIPDHFEEARQLAQAIMDETFAAEFKKIRDGDARRE